MAIAAITISLSSSSSAILLRPHRLSKPLLPPLSFSPLFSHSHISRPLSLSPVFSNSLNSLNPLNPENENPENENPKNENPENENENDSENSLDSGDDGNSGDGSSGDSGEGGDSGGGGGDEGESGGSKNEKEVLMVLAEKGRALDSLPADLAAAVQEGRIPVDIVRRYLELETSPFFKWLMQFAGFRERLLADDLFLAKVAMECGVGIFTKTAAEYERRRENFFKEIEIVCADVVMAVIADFMLVYLPAPTVALRPPLALNAGAIAKFFHGCPDNAFQIALGGASYSLIQRVGAIVRNGAKLFVVGTTSSLVGTTITNIAINARKAVDKSAAEEVENVPILSTSIAYGVYMAVSSNLRYQFVAGIAEQRILEPMFHNQKLILSALCFAVRTGNTFLGSLLWVDYARWIGIQKAH